jgi:hypothetical protein
VRILADCLSATRCNVAMLWLPRRFVLFQRESGGGARAGDYPSCVKQSHQPVSQIDWGRNRKGTMREERDMNLQTSREVKTVTQPVGDIAVSCRRVAGDVGGLAPRRKSLC